MADVFCGKCYNAAGRLEARIAELEAEVARLQRIIDSRPAINAALPESYINWSQGIYAAQAARIMKLHN